jgi:hypothetical protein
MIHEYHDSTNQGIIQGSMPTYTNWDSIWEDKGEKLVCIKFESRWYKDVLEVLKNKENEGYIACKRAYNRHKAEIEKKIGTYVEPKKKDVEMVKVLFVNWQWIGTATVKKGAVSIENYRRPTQTPWTEDKAKLADEYNKMLIENRGKEQALWSKIFKENK